MALEPVADDRMELNESRTKIARVLLVGLAVLGLVAYVPSVLLAAHVGAWSIVVLDTVVYAAILAVLAFGKRNYALQAGVVVGVCFTLGIGLSALLGPTGGGPLWLLAAPVAAAILFDRRAAIASLAFVVLCVLLIPLSLGRLGGTLDAPTDLSLWFVLSGNVILLAGALTIAVTKLIHELHQEMADRQRAERQLLQAEKLQAIGTLAAGIAHDFNNLLTPILTASEMAREEVGEGSQSRKSLDYAIDAALAGRVLVGRILAFSRPSGEGRVPMLASEVLREAVRLLRASIPGSIAVDLHISGDGVILLSVAEVHQIVLNLGTNAQKAMPGGGTIDFRLLKVDASAIDWHSNADRPEVAIRIVVTDTGHGMSPETVSRIFEPFFTTDPEHGNGVGLSTVRGIVTSAGGQISCASEPGVGTTFTIDLPELQPAASAETALPHAPGDAPGASPIFRGDERAAARDRHVLLVDDEQAIREVTRRMLERQGFRVTAVAHGDAALALIDRQPADVSLVLSDLNMPGMSGLQLAERVRESYPGLAIILMSGLVDDELRDQAIASGVDRVIAKPFRMEELQEVVTRLAARNG